MDNLILRYPQKVTSADTDMCKRVRLGALVNYLIQAAIESAEALGFGFGVLHQQQLFWVLNRLTVSIERPLMWGESIVVETWPKCVERIFYYRDFIVYDADGLVVAKATSAWLAIDQASKRPGKVRGEVEALFNVLKDKHALVEAPAKLESVDGDQLFRAETSYFDIDLNAHVTSTRYVDWMMEALPHDVRVNSYPKEMDINFVKETKLGQTIEIIGDVKSEDCRLEGRDGTTIQVAFRGALRF